MFFKRVILWKQGLYHRTENCRVYCPREVTRQGGAIVMVQCTMKLGKERVRNRPEKQIREHSVVIVYHA